MLKIVVGDEGYDEEKKQFVVTNTVILELEHSLISLSKWESIHEKPFLGRETKTTEEVYDYVKCMALNPNIPPEVFRKLNDQNLEDITAYIDAKMSATWFSDGPNVPRSSELITSELIYYWLIAFNIPFEVENWHLNRLFNLIKICNVKMAKPKKMSRSELASRNRKLNAERKQQLGTSG